MLRIISDGLRWITLLALAWPVLLGPWLFASWEMWWFWVGTAFIFIALILGGLVQMLDAVSITPEPENNDGTETRTMPRSRLYVLWGTLLPFLIYAWIRKQGADVVMDAERSFLLFLTPVLIAIPIMFALRPAQHRVLWIALWVNLTLLTLYGIVNLLLPPMDLGFMTIGGGKHVMWMTGYTQYTDQNRASGSYYCPDHYAGIAEIGLGLALAAILVREVKWPVRCIATVIAFLSAWGVILSKSRGGGMTILVMLAAALVVCFSQWPPKVRWYLRGAACAVAALVVVMFVMMSDAYMSRFFEGSESHRYTNTTWPEKAALVKEKIRVSSRGRMYAGALRAWLSDHDAIIFGIGPGMHRNLWPHFAASADGNRELGTVPTLPNYDFHSYEVHNDWLQLAEEYGALGLALFLILMLGILALLQEAARNDIRRRKQEGWHRLGKAGAYPLIAGTQLAIVAMAFHSLGDFNLQMPATVWVLGAIIALALATALRSARMSRS